MILDENPNFFPKFIKNLHIQILINYNKKSNVSKFFFSSIFLFYLTCFKTVPRLRVNLNPLVAEIWGGGGGQHQPHPQWTQVLEITQWE